MEEDRRNTFRILMLPLGLRAKGGAALKGPKFILYKYSHVAHQIEGYEEQNTVVQKFCPRGMSEGHWRSKSRLLGLFVFYYHQTPLRLF